MFNIYLNLYHYYFNALIKSLCGKLEEESISLVTIV